MSSTTETVISADRKPPPEGRLSWEEFLAWSDKNTWAEWVDGEVVPMSPVNLLHQDVLGFLLALVSRYVRIHQLGWVYFAPALMRLATRPSGREPDLMFIATAHADRLRETYVDGPADLAVEIVSPDSYARDRGEKLVEYERAGVPEYWVIDPIRHDAAFYPLGEDGRYRSVQTDADGYYHSAVLPGFRLRVDWLWQRPLPTVEEVAPLTEA